MGVYDQSYNSTCRTKHYRNKYKFLSLLHNLIPNNQYCQQLIYMCYLYCFIIITIHVFLFLLQLLCVSQYITVKLVYVVAFRFLHSSDQYQKSTLVQTIEHHPLAVQLNATQCVEFWKVRHRGGTGTQNKLCIIWPLEQDQLLSLDQAVP